MPCANAFQNVDPRPIIPLTFGEGFDGHFDLWRCGLHRFGNGIELTHKDTKRNPLKRDRSIREEARARTDHQ